MRLVDGSTRRGRRSGRRKLASGCAASSGADRTPFDTIREVQHPKIVRFLTTRIAAVLIAVMLPTSAWAQCAGWQSTAQARMACCVNEGQCPMHSRNGHQSGSGAQTKMTQAEADACCGLSERSTSTPSASSHLTPIVLAVVSTPVSPISPALATLRAGSRDSVPIVSSPVPRHLLLSVFLV